MIVIAGYGYVGKAIEAALSKHEHVEIVDPAFNNNKIQDFDPESLIVAVATPEAEDGSCYMGHVFDVLSDTSENVPVLIKSTISIEGWDELVDRFPKHSITFSPEFLRAKTAVEDFANQDTFLLGGGDTAYWIEFFYRNMEVTGLVYKPEELILAKNFRNSFLATKVAFFNQIYDLCEQLGLDYNNVSRAVALDDRIGSSHIEVTEERGFGGHCFPKDTSAIVETALKFNVNLSLIAEAIKYNNEIRKKD